MSRDNVYNVGLIGAQSNISSKHIDVINENPDFCLKAVCDLNFEALQQNTHYRNLPKYKSYLDMLEKEEINVVAILTPSGTHAEIIIDVAKHCGHIIVEKPMALRLTDADGIISECDRYGAKIFVVNQNRFNRPVRLVRKALDEGRFGKLVMGTIRVRWCRRQEYYDQCSWRGTWKYDGGVLTNQASHHIDMLVWLMGDVESVVAKAATRLANIETEDTAVAILKFKNGALGIIEATTATRPKDIEGSLSILGEKGFVEIGGFMCNEMKLWQFEDSTPYDEGVRNKEYDNPESDRKYGHTEFYKDVFSSIRKNSSGLIDGLQGRKSLELISALYESIETGREVTVNFMPKKCRLGE